MALVVADGTARRKKERTLYKRRITELERETARLKVFEEQDTPAFQRWTEIEFAAEMLEFRKALAKISELEELEHQVRRVATIQRVPFWQAYRDVIAARAAGGLDELLGYRRASDDREGSQSSPHSREDEAEHADEEDELFRMFRDFFGVDIDPDDDEGFRDPFDDDSHAKRDSHRDAQRSSREESSERVGEIHLKVLYRQLVRELHPDAGVELTPERRQLWAEVQDAYAWGDVHRLQKLHAVVCGKGRDAGMSLDFATMPIGDIIGLRRPIERRLREIRKSLRDAKNELYWGFSLLCAKGGKELAKLKAVVARDLKEEMADANRHKASLAKMVASWERGPKPKKPKVSGRPGSKKRSTSSRPRRNDHFHETWVCD